MAWIEAHQSLERSHKLYDLMVSMGWSKHEAIGCLFVFWWWCVDHAENGDLRKFNDGHLALAAELSPEKGKAFVDAMVQAGFLDRKPYFRLHDWWDHLGSFLKARHKKCPQVWKQIEELYSDSATPGRITETLEDDSRPVPARDQRGTRAGPDQDQSRSGPGPEQVRCNPTPPNLTEPNLTEPNQGRGNARAPDLDTDAKRPSLDEANAYAGTIGLPEWRSEDEWLKQQATDPPWKGIGDWTKHWQRVKRWWVCDGSLTHPPTRKGGDHANARASVKPVHGKGF